MIAYKSKTNMLILLVFSALFLGLGVCSIWFDILVIFKVLSLIFTSSLSAILFYTFIYYKHSPKEVFVIDDGKLIIYNKKSYEAYELKDIKEVSFNYNVPYWSIAFAFSIIKTNGEKISIGCFINRQVKVYQTMKKILIENNINITRSYHW